MKPKIGIYKHQLFKISETFIHSQVSNLDHFDPVYFGKEIMGPIPSGYKTIAPFDSTLDLQKLKYLVFKDISPFKNHAKELNLSLIHSYFGMDAVFAEKLSRELKIPLVTTFLGFDVTAKRSYFLKSGKPTLVRYAFEENRLRDNGDLFLCYSNYLRDRLISRGYPAEKTLTHYVGIDLNKQTKLTSRKKKNKIIYVGRLVEKKGCEFLIKAFSKIHTSINDTILEIIGDGPLRKYLTSLTSSLGLESKVKFLGAQSNDIVLQHMMESRIFVMPSITARNGDMEGLPVVLLEAQSLGIPVISTFHSGIPEAVIHEETGLLCAERDIDALAEYMQCLIKDEATASKMGAEGRKRMENNFDIRRQTGILEDYYKKLVV